MKRSEKTKAGLVRLEQWAVCGSGSGFDAPEITVIKLVGVVKGHPNKRDGTRVLTSAIVGASGRTIRTESGTQYVLGDPEPGYRAWLAEHRPAWDPENPITLIRTREDQADA